jgi:hypothetical protein
VTDAVKRTLLAAALLVTSVFGVTGCGSDDDEATVESRIKNSTGDTGLSEQMDDDDDINLKEPDELLDRLDLKDVIDVEERLTRDPYKGAFEIPNLPDFDDLIENDSLDRASLLPEDSDSTWIQNSPSGSGGLDTQSLLNAGHHVGIDTTGCSLRNSNRGLRSEPPNPQVQVSPWLQSTICPDLLLRPLDINDDWKDINDDINDDIKFTTQLNAGFHVPIDTVGDDVDGG